jgi:hypothetical protein
MARMIAVAAGGAATETPPKYRGTFLALLR